eukprot:CAMPEP_0178932594 /NCGR_PEP_ID=MMETSP0786-20121207/22725_1 /TAXON_ID=186022 /ORGANISM="Thalassionema frauenfeldii, Strain CCMP 1798" /LENGTH=440 /DNA_ID=CAMNT_0020609945 /DNA_START=116 /DNA_END=1438 /DNA_ORIENTATION=+
MKPSPPLCHEPPRRIAFDLESLGSEVAQYEERNHSIYQTSRKLQIEVLKAKTFSPGLEHSEADEILQSLVPDKAPRSPREANLSYRVEDYVRFKAFQSFLETGKLLPPSDCLYATDEEYLAGACMGLSQDLAKYSMGRSTARDVESVTIARNLVQEIQSQLLQFDFRNGPLRRKFDGTKYALKTVETLLYELSVTGEELSNGPETKRMKQDFSALVPQEELDALRQRMVHRDNLREKLIKECRDGQKAAKQSIFALHRGDQEKSKELLSNCEKCITEHLLPTIGEEPQLRSGSFSNVLEEYVEGKLFYTWLFGRAEESESPTGDLLKPDEFIFELKPEEYLGGLCDLTGEVGRYAVQRGTVRDTDGVKLALHTNSQILDAIQKMERIPSGVNKKMDQLRRSVEKLERMLYEMSLSEATGRRVKSNAEEPNTIVTEENASL